MSSFRVDGPPRHRARNTLLVLGGLGLAVLLLDWTLGALDVFQLSFERDLARYRRELSLRVDTGGGQAVARHRAQASVSFQGFEIATDAAGCRVPSSSSTSVPPPAGDARRILLLGGGTGLGWGVADEDGVARRLEAALAERYLVRGSRVVNMSHLLFEPAQAAQLLLAGGLALRLDLVMLLCEERQLAISIDSPADERSLPARLLPALSAVIAHLASPGQRRLAAEEARRSRFTERDRQAVSHLDRLCREHGIGLLVLDLGRGESGPTALQELCAEHEIRCADLRFGSQDRALPIFDPTPSPFPNALGHDLLVRKLLAVLRAEDLLEPK